MPEGEEVGMVGGRESDSTAQWPPCQSQSWCRELSWILSSGFLTETGKTRASIIFSTGTEALFQVTQLRIKVVFPGDQPLPSCAWGMSELDFRNEPASMAPALVQGSLG